ncbi:MAG: DUF4286 family protein [Bacteroidia bacterium]
MLIYNVTVNVENDVRDQWVHWMKTEHMPAVIATGYFTESKLYKVLVSEEQGTTYSAQYSCNNHEDLAQYKLHGAPLLQKEASDKFGGKFSAFRTNLELI